MYRVELAKALHRWRTWLLAAAIGGIPVVIVFALKVSPPDAARRRGRPPFLFQIASNGLFAALTGLAVVQPFFLPLATGLFAGDADRGGGPVGNAALPAAAARSARRGWCWRSTASAMTLLGGLRPGHLGRGAGGRCSGVRVGTAADACRDSTLSVTEGLARVGLAGLYMLAVLSGGSRAWGCSSRPGPTRARGGRRNDRDRDREPDPGSAPEPAMRSIRSCRRTAGSGSRGCSASRSTGRRCVRG